MTDPFVLSVALDVQEGGVRVVKKKMVRQKNGDSGHPGIAGFQKLDGSAIFGEECKPADSTDPVF